MKPFLFSLLLVVSFDVLGVEGDVWIGSEAVTIHEHESKKRIPYNERNFALSVEYELPKDFRAIGGFYKNSAYRDSFYGGASWGAAKYGPMHAGLFVGAVTGYENRPMLIGGPIFAIEGKQFGMNFIALPGVVYVWQLKVKIQ